MSLRTVRVPKGMERAFAKAEKVVAGYFAKAKHDPAKGTIGIFGERYVLVRAAALSCEFFALLRELFGKGRRKEADAFARNLLFDLAHAIGRTDARDFHARMKLDDPVERLSAGPVHFAHTGWAFVDILPSSNAVPNEAFCLVFDHPYSFEADAWIREKRPADFPVCVMNAGYSSGWCEESFGLPLVASEIECRGHGGERCRFVMAPPARLEERIREHAGAGAMAAARDVYEIPDFFARKRAEDALRESEELYRTLTESSPDTIFITGADGVMRYVNSRGADLLHRSAAEIVGRKIEDLFPASTYERMLENARRVLESGQPVVVDEPVDLPNGTDWFSTNLMPLRDGRGRATAIFGILRDISVRKTVEERLAKLNSCITGFGVDSVANINRMVAVCGELLGATCALYNRFEDGMLCSLGRWNTPPDFDSRGSSEGHICYDVIRRDSDELFVVRNLLKTPYAATDPNVLVYNLETYVGRSVRADGKAVGSLCCVWQRDVVPTDADAKLLGIAAAIIGNEEARLRGRVALEKRLRELERMDDLTIGREGRVIELKHEVNELLKQLGQLPRYSV